MEVVRRQRNRKINTCLECRRLKRRCSKTQPCTHCLKTARECIFPATTTSSTQPVPPAPSQLTERDPLDERQLEHGSGSEQSFLRTSPTDDNTPPDICLRIGKLNITERIGGMPRSNVANEIDEMLQTLGFAGDDPAEAQFSAPLSAWFKPHAVLPCIYSNASFSEKAGFSRAQQQFLVDQFFLAVYPVCPIVSRRDLESSSRVGTSIQLAVEYAAAVSLPLLESQQLFGMSKNSLVTKLHEAAADAIRQTDPIMRLDVGIFQAILIYLTPQFLSEVSRSHSTHIGAIIRQYQIARFDRDMDQDSHEDRKLKRHMWQHLMFLNQRAVEGAGPEKAIIDDPHAQLPHTMNEVEDAEVLSIVRYKCYSIHRWVFQERIKVRSGDLTLTECLDMLESSTTELQVRYLDNLDRRIPLQKYTFYVAKLLLNRTKGMILHGVNARWDDWTRAMAAEELRDRAIQANLNVLEAAVILETDPDLASWAWYAGAYHQYHSILFPLGQVCAEPGLPDADRIMAVADFVFGPSSNLSNPQKRAVMIMRAIRDNLKSFLSMLRTQSTSSATQLIDQPRQPVSSTIADSLSTHDYSGPSVYTGGPVSLGEQGFSDGTIWDMDPLSPAGDGIGVWWRWQPGFQGHDP